MLPQQLPSDVWLQIWSFLATPDVVRCQSTCKGLWSEAIQSQCLWSARYRRDFGLEVRIPRGCAAVLLDGYIPTTDCVRRARMIQQHRVPPTSRKPGGACACPMIRVPSTRFVSSSGRGASLCCQP